jgi:methylmalonyl-CoA mutase cobalamin-binding subunit
MLAEIGELWAQGTLTVGMEHRFSAVARDLTAHFRKQVEPALRGSPPDLLLFSAPNNSHNLGLQMAEFYFAISGIPALVSLTAPSLTEVMELVDLHAPKAVGFSVAMPGQMGPVREMAEAIRNRPGPSPYVLVGGPAVRLGLQGEPASGIHACLDFTDAMAFL